MKIKKYLNITVIVIIISMVFLNCKPDETAQNSCADGPFDINILDIYSGSVYFKVIAPDAASKVIVNVSSSDSMDQGKTIKYELVKSATEWVGIITNLSLDSKKVAIVSAYNNNSLLYTGKTNFSVFKDNAAMVIVKLDKASSSESFIKSIVLSSYKVTPSGTIEMNVLADNKKNDKLSFQWTGRKGYFVDYKSDKSIWKAPDANGTYDLTVSAKDSDNNIDHLTFRVEVDPAGAKKPELLITKLKSIPQSIKLGKSTQIILDLESNCLPRTPEEYHMKCHNYCDQFLEYSWTSSCPGSFSDKNIDSPVFTPAITSSSETCTLSVVVKNKCAQITTSTEIYVAQENSKPVITSVTADKYEIKKDESMNLNVEAHDADGDTLSYNWTTNCDISFDDPTLQNPQITVLSNATYGECSIFVEVTDGTDTVSGYTKIDIIETIINEAPIILSSFQMTDVINIGQEVLFIVRANDPEGTPLSFSWSSPSGTFAESIETVTDEYTESFVAWTAPDCGVDPIDISVDISDADGYVTKKIFLPITLADGEACE